MPTPVGPVPRNPNDPDFWDWEPDDERSMAARHPGRAVIAGFVVVLMVIAFVSVVH